jgi:hypothetical protein
MFSLSAIPAAAQEGGEEGGEVTEPAGEEEVPPAQEEPVDEPAVVEPDPSTEPVDETVPESGDEEVVEEEVVDEVVEEEEAVEEEATNESVGTSEDVAEPAEDVVEPTEESLEPGAGVVEETEPAAEVVAADDVESATALPGNFSSQIIAVANLNTTGSRDPANLTLDEIGGNNTGSAAASIFPGGVEFLNLGTVPNGSFSGILSSQFPAAAAVLTINQQAKVADAYPGLSSTSTGVELYALGILNKHANFESRFYCQNAGGSPATIKAELFETGVATARATVTSASLAAGEAVRWDIADTAIQSQWPGGAGKFGYAKFTSANTIACVVDNQRTVAPHVQSIYQAVPTNGYASQDGIAPGIFNGHGSSSTNVKGRKFISAIAIVNPNPGAATVSVQFISAVSNYTNTCTASVPGGSMVSWIAPDVGTSASPFTCTGGPLAWQYPGGPTLGTALVTSNISVMALVNSNKYDTGENLGAGYSSLVAARTAPTVVTTKAVCPLAFNKNVANDWISGIQAVNVGGSPTNITFKMVRAGQDPAAGGASHTLSGGKFNNIASNAGVSAVLYQDQTTLTNFEGAVFVESSGQPIAVVSSSTNYTTLGAAALYDCINY